MPEPKITYDAKLVRQTKNFWVYEYGKNQLGEPFKLYVPKPDFTSAPLRAMLTLEAQ